jgi:hypothetical protein
MTGARLDCPLKSEAVFAAIRGVGSGVGLYRTLGLRFAIVEHARAFAIRVGLVTGIVTVSGKK